MRAIRSQTMTLRNRSHSRGWGRMATEKSPALERGQLKEDYAMSHFHSWQSEAHRFIVFPE
jgi:hypothetical protein